MRKVLLLLLVILSSVFLGGCSANQQ